MRMGPRQTETRWTGKDVFESIVKKNSKSRAMPCQEIGRVVREKREYIRTLECKKRH